MKLPGAASWESSAHTFAAVVAGQVGVADRVAEVAGLGLVVVVVVVGSSVCGSFRKNGLEVFILFTYAYCYYKCNSKAPMCQSLSAKAICQFWEL
jgi:hypothetical protein